MKIRFQPPPPPPPPAAPPKPLPTPLEVEQKTRELIETAQKQRSQRIKRRELFKNRKKADQEKDDLNSNPKDGKTANPDDQTFDILA